MQLGITEILAKVDKAKGKKTKVDMLRSQAQNVTLLKILHGALNPNVKWVLPEGPVPYGKNKFVDQESSLYVEARKLYMFVEGGHNGLSEFQRQKLFIQFLESIDKDDAELIVAMKDKKLPFKTITAEIVEEAFPTLTTCAPSIA